MRKSVIMILLVLVLGGLIAGTVLVQNLNKKQETKEEGISLALVDSEITGLDFTTDGVSFHLVREADGWETDRGYAVNQEEADRLSEAVHAVTAYRKVEGGTLADYGLETPVFTITVTAGGKSTELCLGNATPFEDGYYVSRSSDDGVVYLVRDDFSAEFAVDLGTVVMKEPLPHTDHIVRITKSDGLDATYAADGIRENPKKHWQDTASGMALAEQDMENLVSTIQTLSWASLVTVEATPEDLDVYGLSDEKAVSLVVYGDEEVVLYLGKKDDTGATYARLPSSNMVYTISSGDAAPILNASLDVLWDRSVLNLAYEDLVKAEFRAGNATLEIQGSSASMEEENEAAEEAGEISAEQQLWELFASAKAGRRVSEGEGDILLFGTYDSVNGGHVDFSVCEYDASNYLLILDGQRYTVDGSTMDTVIRTVRSIARDVSDLQ